MQEKERGITISSEEEWKQQVEAEYNRRERGGKAQKPHKKHNYPTNYTPPKKKRKK